MLVVRADVSPKGVFVSVSIQFNFGFFLFWLLLLLCLHFSVGREGCEQKMVLVL
jgi:hypothetical protein